MLRFLFDFRGRVPRASYCLFALAAFLSFLALLAAFYAYAMSLPGAYENGGPTPWPSSWPGVAAACLWYAALGLILLSSLAVSLKRLHDRGKAWWWLLVFIALPDALFALGRYWRDAAPGSGDEGDVALRAASFAITAWAFAELCCLQGARGTNRFGPDPLAKHS